MTREEFEALYKKLNLRADDLAKELGLRRSSIYRYLSGTTKIPKTVELAMETITRKLLQPDESNTADKISLLINSTSPINEYSLKGFGQDLKNSRIKRSMMQKDIAEFTELSMSYLSDVENGKKDDFTLSTIQKFAQVLKIKIEILFEYQEKL